MNETNEAGIWFFCCCGGWRDRKKMGGWEGRGRPPTDARSRGRSAVVAALGGVVAWRLRVGSATWRNTTASCSGGFCLPRLFVFAPPPPMRLCHGLLILRYFI